MNEFLQLIPPVSLIIVIYIITGVVLYYLFIMRKLKKRQSKFVDFHEQLKVGDNVVVLNALYGKIVRMYDDVCEIELNPNNIIKVSRYSISAAK